MTATAELIDPMEALRQAEALEGEPENESLENDSVFIGVDPSAIVERGIKTLISNEIPFGDLTAIMLDQEGKGGAVEMAWFDSGATAQKARMDESECKLRVEVRDNKYVIGFSSPPDFLQYGVRGEYDGEGKNVTIPQGWVEMSTPNPSRAASIFQFAAQAVASKQRIEQLLKTGIGQELTNNIRGIKGKDSEHAQVAPYLQSPQAAARQGVEPTYSVHLFPSNAQNLSNYVGVVAAKRDNTVLLATANRSLFTVHELDEKSAQALEVGTPVHLSYKGVHMGRTVGWDVKPLTDLNHLAEAHASQKQLTGNGRYALGAHLSHKAYPHAAPFSSKESLPALTAEVSSAATKPAVRRSRDQGR